MQKKRNKTNRIIMCCTAHALFGRHCICSGGYSRSGLGYAWNGPDV